MSCCRRRVVCRPTWPAVKCVSDHSIATTIHTAHHDPLGRSVGRNRSAGRNRHDLRASASDCRAGSAQWLRLLRLLDSGMSRREQHFGIATRPNLFRFARCDWFWDAGRRNGVEPIHGDIRMAHGLRGCSRRRHRLADDERLECALACGHGSCVGGCVRPSGSNEVASKQVKKNGSEESRGQC